MCGVCGILAPGADPGARDRRVRAMSDALRHRGPDDEGWYSDSDLAFGFRRLAVIDLETGQQPIRLENDRAVIVLNGEIYNYRELRADLARRQTFRSKGDVEVVLRLYAEEGIDALRRLNGMFALALWDRERRTLYLARDRHGIKPLFLCREGETVAFASEMTALLAGGFPGRREVDELQLRHYLWQKHLSPGGAILKGVRPLPPATILEIGPAGERERRYWSPPSGPLGGGASPGSAEAVARTESLLRAAVRRQLVADVPVGVFLSGGLDSGTLAALVKAAGAVPLRTFSVGFEGPGVVNELPAARAVAAALGTEHHELTMNPSQIARDLPRILARLDGPLGDATAIPTWCMSAHARSVVTVALSGEGADELFGGYARQRYDAWLDAVGPVGRRLLPLAMPLLGHKVSPRLSRRLSMPSGIRRQLDWSRIFTEEQIDALARTKLPDEQELLALYVDFAARWGARTGHDPIGARLETDRELFLPGDLLPKVDRMSMAHSLEVRVPYLDDEVVDFVVPLPGSLKVRPSLDKALLRGVAVRVSPNAAERPKQGFHVPIGAWLRGPLRGALTDYLAPEALRRRGLLRADGVAGMIDDHLAGRADHGEPLWLLVAFEGFMQEVVDRPPEG